jgi:hypothetical protein
MLCHGFHLSLLFVIFLFFFVFFLNQSFDFPFPSFPFDFLRDSTTSFVDLRLELFVWLLLDEVEDEAAVVAVVELLPVLVRLDLLTFKRCRVEDLVVGGVAAAVVEVVVLG